MRRAIIQFLALESSGAIFLLLMALLAIVWVNSPLAYLHQQFVDRFLFIINDGLMAVFFLVVGLELKRGFIEGELSHLSEVILPGVAALGGMLVPAVIYAAINYHNPVTLKAWATPVATDIAFAIGVLALFGRGIPTSIRLFLLSLAIFDDIGAILIIALFYSHGLSYVWLLVSVFLALILCLMNVLSVRRLAPYLLVGVGLWISLLYTGVHPTIAGVWLAFTIPDGREVTFSPLLYLEKTLHPWVAYLIMPLFALANAGVSLADMNGNMLNNTVVMGIVLGLFIGKQLGVFGFSWILIRCRLANLPQTSTWLMLYGVALLCGIGFTMSLFLGTLSFQLELSYLSDVRLGVILGSLLSGTVGALVLRMAIRRKLS